MKQTLQRFAIRTQFPPFVWLYRAVYGFAIRLCVRRFRAMRGVRAVYLRRGLVSGEPFYGLSDIDLLVVIDEAEARRLTARLRYQYDLIRRLFPMLAEGELAIYTVLQFRLLYEHSPFYRQRFDRGRREWKRLFGEDVFQHLLKAPAQLLADWGQELGPAWRYLSQDLWNGDERPLYLRKYVTHKWLADAAQAALDAQGHVVGRSQQATLRDAVERFPEIANTLDRVATYRHRLLASDPIPIDEVWAAYRHLAHAGLTTASTRSVVSLTLRIAVPEVDEGGVYVGQESLNSIESAVYAVPGVERAVLVPRLDLSPLAWVGADTSQLAGATVDAFDLVLLGQRLPPADALHAFAQRIAPLRPAVDAYFCDGPLALALQGVQGWPLRDPGHQPEFFALLSTAQPLKGPVEVATTVELDRPFEHVNALKERAKTWLHLFDNGDAFRLPLLAFFALFWEAGRAAWMAAQLGKPVIEVPTQSVQVVEALCAWTPHAQAPLRQIHREYVKTARGQPSEAIRHMHWAAWYAQHLADLLGLSPERTAEPPPSRRTELTMSVVIVTRNRAALLKGALASLARQERLPDQVVVVDNASSDDTMSVVESYARALNVTAVHEEKVGIPHARNAGLAHCTGDIIAFLDDDCEADPSWLKELEQPFLKDPLIGAVGGRIAPLESQEGPVARLYQSRMELARTPHCAGQGAES